eukprot:12831911-Alexandrium_andersonii.AAC.1
MLSICEARAHSSSVMQGRDGAQRVPVIDCSTRAPASSWASRSSTVRSWPAGEQGHPLCVSSVHGVSSQPLVEFVW